LVKFRLFQFLGSWSANKASFHSKFSASIARA
jgi:hypothetical protein